jgi:hypothetical protein
VGGILVSNQEVGLGEMVASLQKRPQVMALVRVCTTPPLEQISALQEQKKRTQRQIGDDCRIVVWYSSTERGGFGVMVEGGSRSILEDVSREARAICQAVQQATRSEQAQIEVLNLSVRHCI